MRYFLHGRSNGYQMNQEISGGNCLIFFAGLQGKERKNYTLSTHVLVWVLPLTLPGCVARFLTS